MKTAIMIMLLSIVCVAQEQKPEPKRLLSIRKQYLEKLGVIESERDAKVKVLSKNYIRALEKIQVSLTKSGDLDGALAVRKEIASIKPVTEPPKLEVKKPEPEPKKEPVVEKKEPEPEPEPGVAMTKVVIHQTYNTPANNGGTKNGVLILFLDGKEVFTKKFGITWRPGWDTKREIELPFKTRADKIRIVCKKEKGKFYPGLAEVQVFDGEANIVRQAELQVSSEIAHHEAKYLTDGITVSNGGRRGNWLAQGGADGWIEFSWK